MTGCTFLIDSPLNWRVRRDFKCNCRKKQRKESS